MHNATLIPVFYFLAGILISYLFTRLYFSGRTGVLMAKHEPLVLQCDQLKTERDNLLKEKSDLMVKAGNLETRLGLLQTGFDEQKDSLGKVSEAFRNEFHKLAQDILDSKSIRKLEEIKQMGAKAKKSFPDKLVKEANQEQEVFPGLSTGQ